MALALVALAGLILAGCGADSDTGAPPVRSSFDGTRAFADLEAQVAIGPRPAGTPKAAKTAALLVRRLQQAGVDQVGIQRPWQNVVGRIEGTQPGAIVIGAHYDTVAGIPGFVGANDGASGVAVVLEIARVLGQSGGGVDGPSVHFALFDAEEARPGRSFDRDGTRGSRQYVALAAESGDARRQGSADLDQIESMILFDLVGDCDLKIPREAGSDLSIYDSIAASAKANGSRGIFEGETGPISDDHIPFLEAGIPAVDLIDFSFGPGGTPGAWWHTADDSLEKVCPQSLAAVGSAVLAILPAPR